jgi:glucosamine-6-phosphate deaminase
MALKVLVTRDFEHMSEVTARLAEDRIKRVEAGADEVILGLATGNSPTGVYRLLADSANRGVIDSSRWRTFNLDEYIGLPGETPEQRAAHPEGYTSFMIQNFFSLLERQPVETNLPPAHIVEQDELIRALEENRSDWELLGSSTGKALAITDSPESMSLAGFKQDILEDYSRRIAQAGGIDLQIIGVGGRGHVAFHESGIPFELKGLLLVRLDEVTQRHAVADGHFSSLEECPKYALTMSVDLVFQAKCVLVLANGKRKTAAITDSLLSEPSCEVPLSYAQHYAKRGGEVIFVLDAEAADGLLAQRSILEEKGIELEDLRSEC